MGWITMIKSRYFLASLCTLIVIVHFRFMREYRMELEDVSGLELDERFDKSMTISSEESIYRNNGKYNQMIRNQEIASKENDINGAAEGLN